MQIYFIQILSGTGAFMRSQDVKKPLKLNIFMLDLMKSVDLDTSTVGQSMT